MNWIADNELEIADLRAEVRAGDVTCAHDECENAAVDVHHVNGHHDDNRPENLVAACKLCHNEWHDISAEMSDLKLLTRLFYEAQRQRIRANNRVQAYERLGIETPYAHKALEDAKAYEKHLEGHIKALLKTNTFYNSWLKHVKGIGPRLAASLLAEMGSAKSFDSVSALWAYAGLAVVDGEAVRRTKGEHSRWNHALKMAAWKVGSQFVKTRDCLGRRLYDDYKLYYIERDGAEPKWRPHRRAVRRVAKDFLRCLWAAWRECAGYPVTEPRPGTWPMPDDWIENGEAEEVAYPEEVFAPSQLRIMAG